MSSTWARKWGRFTEATGYLNLASQALDSGDLQAAVSCAVQNRLDVSAPGRKLLRRLVSALIEKSRQQIAGNQYTQAWASLDSAAEVAIRQDRDCVSREKSELVELTIDCAESFLIAGKIAHSLKLIEELHSRQILDWRADRIRIAGEKIQAAETYAAKGEFAKAIELLEEAKQLRPDLPILECRIVTYRLRQKQIKELTDELHSSLVPGHWHGVARICHQLLVIAPNYEVALNAQRRLLEIRKKKTSAGSHKTTYENPNQQNPPVRGFPMSENQTPSPHNNDSSFMLWIDGVGGYLVCPATQNTIGQAIAQSNVQIPILGDIQRRHCRIETVDQSHMIQPLGNLTVNGKKTVDATTLKNQQLIEFEGGVHLRYAKPHPLSGSARLEFHSRHRTQPWSDCVLLASGPIILGPNRQNHVYCPRWAVDLVIFRREGNWYARTEGNLEIDGQQYEQEGPLRLNSRIVGEEFTMSLEPVGA